MTTRFNIPPGDDVIDSGYSNKSTTSSYTIPPCNIIDIDKAFFSLFSDDIQFSIKKRNHGVPSTVKVVFSAAERWRLTKDSKSLRDENGVLILPIISIVRTTIMQEPGKDIAGRGMNQHTGKLILKRRLANEDRYNENSKNRFGITNQSNLPVSYTSGSYDQYSTTSDISQYLLNDPDVAAGAFFKVDNRQNAYEYISIPTPQFVTVNYEVIFWTQYLEETNTLIEILLSSFLPTGHKSLKLKTTAGYWFIAQMTSNEFSPESNFDNLTDSERIVKYKMNFEVPAFILASSAPGVPIAVHRYVANTKIDFQINESSSTGNFSVIDANAVSGELVTDPFLGADDPTLPTEVNRLSQRRDARYTGDTELYSRGGKLDPANVNLRRGASKPVFKKVRVRSISGKESIRFLRVKTQNTVTGETVFATNFELGDIICEIIELKYNYLCR